MKPKSWQTYLRIFAPFAFFTSLCVLVFASAVSIFLEAELFSMQYARELESLQRDAVACAAAYRQQVKAEGQAAVERQPLALLPAHLQQPPQSEHFFLMTQEGVVLTENHYFPMGSQLKQAPELTAFFSKGQDCYSLTAGNEPLLCCAARVGGAPLVLVGFQPANQLNSGYQKLQGTVVSGALIVFALSFLSSVLFASRPVKNILAANERLSLSEWGKRRQAAQLFLASLCFYGRSQEEIEQALPGLDTPLNLQNPVGLFLVQIDGLVGFRARPQREQSALLYAIKNLMEEQLQSGYAVVGLPDADRRWLLFLYQPMVTVSGLCCDLCTARDKAAQLLELSLSLTLSRQTCPAQGLYKQYERLAQATRLRLFFGEGCCIDLEQLTRQEKAPGLVQAMVYRNVEDLNRKLKLGEVQDAAPYCALLAPYRGWWVEYQTVLLAIKNGLEQFWLVLQSGHWAVPDNLVCPLAFDACETEAQIEAKLYAYVGQLVAQLQGAEQHRLAGYAQQANLLIENHFFDSGYGVQQLANDMGLSTAYISKVYKEQTGSGLIEQLTVRRMQQAAYLIGETQLPMADVWKQAGYASVNYFYRVFRKTYGVTPAEYRRQTQQQTNQTEVAPHEKT